MTETLECTDIDVDLDLVPPCEVPDDNKCPNSAEWIWVFKCAVGTHRLLACTPCKDEITTYIKDAPSVSCVRHNKHVQRMEWRPL